ncbi:UNVERIFIED_CONTAM: hypothetical protein GTU68_026478 [Idotea baltica]|nr:hypothetical protein [Idotea baltica]
MTLLLAIESSCDETSAAVIKDGEILSNIISSQLEHSPYGGVVPELASRLHQQAVVRVVQQALDASGVEKQALDAIGYTRGPGLLGALLVGSSFAKAFALALNIPLVEVNHMQAHVLANFLKEPVPKFPFICLTVSGGHTQLVLVKDYLDMEIIGQSIDDAAGEAFDKAAKIMGLGYPGGPLIDQLSQTGDPLKYQFPKPKVGELDFSFSGLKTSHPEFIEKNKADICASYQNGIVSYLMDKFALAAKIHGVNDLAIAGGVSANSKLRAEFKSLSNRMNCTPHIPDFQYCTDNAGMIAVAAFHKFRHGIFSPQSATPFTRERFL